MHRITAAVAAAVVLALASSCADDAQRPGVDWQLIANRFWLSHIPQSEIEYTRSLVMLDKPEAKGGAAVEASQWRIVAVLFEWRATASGADVRFPQFERDERWTLRAWKCKGEAQPPFELCLVVGDGQIERRYFSAKDWKLEDDVDAAALREVAVRGPPRD